jgi:hypothetical protein
MFPWNRQRPQPPVNTPVLQSVDNSVLQVQVAAMRYEYNLPPITNISVQVLISVADPRLVTGTVFPTLTQDQVEIHLYDRETVELPLAALHAAIRFGGVGSDEGAHAGLYRYDIEQLPTTPIPVLAFVKVAAPFMRGVGVAPIIPQPDTNLT